MLALAEQNGKYIYNGFLVKLKKYIKKYVCGAEQQDEKKIAPSFLSLPVHLFAHSFHNMHSFNGCKHACIFMLFDEVQSTHKKVRIVPSVVTWGQIQFPSWE